MQDSKIRLDQEKHAKLGLLKPHTHIGMILSGMLLYKV